MPEHPSPKSVVGIDVARINASLSSTPAKPTKPKGGMCLNPFGGFDRLDRVDLFAYAGGNDSHEKLLYLAVIKQALADYLYFGLGKNCHVAAEFFYAGEYFFTCRSFIPETWNHSRVVNEIISDEETGKRQRRIVRLTKDELQLMCFDRHYEIAELDRHLPIDKFVNMLEDQRLSVLAKNWNQVRSYLNIADEDEYEALRELVRPNTIPHKRHRATSAMPAHKHQPQTNTLGLNSVRSGAIEAA